MMPIPWDYLRANLVSQADIGRRLQRGRGHVTLWKQKYPDWPAPVLTISAWADHGERDLYWWPPRPAPEGA